MARVFDSKVQAEGHKPIHKSELVYKSLERLMGSSELPKVQNSARFSTYHSMKVFDDYVSCQPAADARCLHRGCFHRLFRSKEMFVMAQRVINRLMRWSAAGFPEVG